MNNMNGYQNFNGFGYPQAGVTPNAPAQGVNVKSWLPDETIRRLKKDHEQFTFSVTEEEIERARCNHRDVNGMLSLYPNDDGTCTCAICNHKFSITEALNEEDVVHATEVIENILQTSKLMYISLDPNIGREFYQVLAFIKKIPKLYKIASEDYKKYENVYGFTQGIPQNAFGIFSSMTNPGFGGYTQYTGQPGMMGYQQPMGYAPQPVPMNNQMVGNPFYQQPGMMGYPNPPQMMGYQQPNGYAPQPVPTAGYQQPPVQNQGFAMNPQGAAANTPNTTPVDNKAGEGAVVKDQFKG